MKWHEDLIGEAINDGEYELAKVMILENILHAIEELSRVLWDSKMRGK